MTSISLTQVRTPRFINGTNGVRIFVLINGRSCLGSLFHESSPPGETRSGKLGMVYFVKEQAVSFKSIFGFGS